MGSFKSGFQFSYDCFIEYVLHVCTSYTTMYIFIRILLLFFYLILYSHYTHPFNSYNMKRKYLTVARLRDFKVVVRRPFGHFCRVELIPFIPLSVSTMQCYSAWGRWPGWKCWKAKKELLLGPKSSMHTASKHYTYIISLSLHQLTRFYSQQKAPASQFGLRPLCNIFFLSGEAHNFCFFLTCVSDKWYEILKNEIIIPCTKKV